MMEGMTCGLLGRTAAVAVLLVLAACGDEGGDQRSARSSDAAEGSSTSPTPITKSPSASPAPTTGTPAAPKSPVPATTAPDRRNGSGPADRPGDLARGYRTLAGTISTEGGCRVLKVGSDRWALIGALAEGLTDGAHAEVRGTVIGTPSGCTAPRALKVSGLGRR